MYADFCTIGTKRYLAPELLMNEISVNFEDYKGVDVYALGLVLWETMPRCKGADMSLNVVCCSLFACALLVLL